MTPTLLCIIILVHWFADFVCQTDQMAVNKSTNNMWLLKHVSVYALFLLPFGPAYAAINFAAHLVTDWLSSRASSYFWKKQDRHNFFVVIGFDQALHMMVLVLTIPLMGW